MVQYKIPVLLPVTYIFMIDDINIQWLGSSIIMSYYNNAENSSKIFMTRNNNSSIYCIHDPVQQY
jgi:hypothetical protein